MIRSVVSIACALTLALGILSGCGADDPQSQLQTIKEKLAKNIPMTQEQQQEVERLVSEGSKLLTENKPTEASKAFAGALKTLTAAEDADRFNKAE